MEDERIVALYWSRNEEALTQTASKYGGYLWRISYHILADHEDARECVNDTYHDAWNAMPPHRPAGLAVFLGKITRRISIDCWRRKNAQKRGGGQLPLALEELRECAGGDDPADAAERAELLRAINTFLDELPETERRVFLRRYWYFDPIAAIAQRFGFSESKVTSMLHRIRGRLRVHLEKEGC